jgi:DNA repair protein RecO (recombination protein O)
MTRQSEAIVLRTYPLREADLLVTLFTRSEGKIRGVAKSAKKSKRRFGGALEPLTCVRAYWDEREKQDLARLDACEVLDSPLTTPVDYPRAVALAHVAEVIDELLPDREGNDAVFRLALAVLAALRNTAQRVTPLRRDAEDRGSDKQEVRAICESPRRSVVNSVPASIWLPLTYFDLWMLRLVGFLPDLSECITCGTPLNGGQVFYHALADGLMCPEHKRLASSEISPESRALAVQMFRVPLESLMGPGWPRERAADLRRFLLQTMERHLERKLATVVMLDRL